MTFSLITIPANNSHLADFLTWQKNRKEISQPLIIMVRYQRESHYPVSFHPWNARPRVVGEQRPLLYPVPVPKH